MISIHHIQFSPKALGFGSRWSGGIDTASQAYPPLVEFLGLPEGTVSFGTVLLGNAAEHFERIPAEAH